ncbi:protein translocase subunit SecA, chloroplastic [Baffinella frigidus]|nr:protein translocase subunit SecA, chloroplastic [Cryptophyta sp. CCMP2293]
MGGELKPGSIGDSENREIVDAYISRVEEKMNPLEDALEKMSDEDLTAKTAMFRARLAKGETEDDILDEAFAVVREAAWRVLKMRHYDVQLVGGLCLQQAPPHSAQQYPDIHSCAGKLAEMATGEGKTLVASLPSYLNALSGKGVHIVTVNDYLAQRDAENIGQIHRFLGLTVGLIQADQTPDQRRKNYLCDLTYVTNSELGFDYLRDNLAMTEQEMVLTRPFNFCIVDEADSIMIDEARTPLIISEKTAAPVTKYANSAKIASVLEENVHYAVDERSQAVTLTERGFADVERILNIKDLFNPRDPWSPYITNALKAKALFKKEVQYVLKGSEVMIVDEFTGRVLEGRRWSNGLHQSVEAKEGLKPTAETQTVASITYQSMFRLFPTLAGMTGTAKTEDQEFKDIYELDVVQIPTTLPVARRDNPDATFRTQQGKWKAVMGDVARRHTKGQPILIGTTSVEASENLDRILTEFQVPHEILNAKPENVERESEIFAGAQAGRAFAITVATNMAARGTDILLGGNAARRLGPQVTPRNSLSKPYTRNTGGECGDRRRGDEGRGGGGGGEDHRGDTREATRERRTMLQRVTYPEHTPEGKVSVDMKELDSMLAVAAETGPVTPNSHMDLLRAAYLASKSVFNERCAKEKAEVEELGGLHVIGTERHESRRIDKQLRGRAGRQGDPGSSRFFLALDDKLFQVFGASSIEPLLKTLRVEEDMPLEAQSVTTALDKVQQNVEEYFYGIRKEMFKYDEILRTQREAAYIIRRRLVMNDDAGLSDEMLDYSIQTADEIIPNYFKDKTPVDAAGLVAKLKQFFEGIELTEAEVVGGQQAVREIVIRKVEAVLASKEGELDAVKGKFAGEIERYITLTQMDNLWKQHLKDMDFLKEFVGLRTYKQSDPFEDYQEEGFELFTEMLAGVRRNSVYSFFQYKLKNEENKVLTGEPRILTATRNFLASHGQGTYYDP